MVVVTAHKKSQCLEMYRVPVESRRNPVVSSLKIAPGFLLGPPPVHSSPQKTGPLSRLLTITSCFSFTVESRLSLHRHRSVSTWSLVPVLSFSSFSWSIFRHHCDGGAASSLPSKPSFSNPVGLHRPHPAVPVLGLTLGISSLDRLSPCVEYTTVRTDRSTKTGALHSGPRLLLTSSPIYLLG